ncbi:hypothetical protein M3J09_011993 [Ascochyta lentis]
MPGSRAALGTHDGRPVLGQQYKRALAKRIQAAVIGLVENGNQDGQS